MNATGPVTEQKIKTIRTIKHRVEAVGRAMGIPEEQALVYIEIESRDRLTEEIHSLHDDEKNWHEKAAVWKGIIRKGIAYIAGLLKSEE